MIPGAHIQLSAKSNVATTAAAHAQCLCKLEFPGRLSLDHPRGAAGDGLIRTIIMSVMRS